MDTKLDYELYSLVPSEPTVTMVDAKRHVYNPTTTPHRGQKKGTFHTSQKVKNCQRFSKYGVAFFGVILIILMVVFGINNISFIKFSSMGNSTINATTIQTEEDLTIPQTTTGMITNTTTIPQTTTGMITNTTTIPQTTTEQMEDATTILSIDFEYDDVTPTKDVVISNKTIYINGGNDSVVVTDESV